MSALWQTHGEGWGPPGEAWELAGRRPRWAQKGGQSYLSQGIWRQGTGSFCKELLRFDTMALSSYTLTCALLRRQRPRWRPDIGAIPSRRARLWIPVELPASLRARRSPSIRMRRSGAKFFSPSLASPLPPISRLGRDRKSAGGKATGASSGLLYKSWRRCSRFRCEEFLCQDRSAWGNSHLKMYID